MSDELRYAVLRHTGTDQPHFDLVFETHSGSELITWRSPAWPIIDPTPLERIADHRREYLDYQGPISKGRGRVDRVAGGSFRYELADEKDFRIRTDAGLRLSIKVMQGAIWLAEVSQASG